MSQSSDGDGQQRYVLAFVFGLVALVVSTVVGVVVFKRGIQHAPPAPAAVAVVLPTTEEKLALVPLEAAAVRVEHGVVKFYFATGRADVAEGAAHALADVVQGVGAGRTAVVSGFHDSTGDAAVNEELAKQRALAVRDALVAQGVAVEKIELRKPQVSAGSGPDAEARRVEVVLAN